MADAITSFEHGDSTTDVLQRGEILFETECEAINGSYSTALACYRAEHNAEARMENA